LLRAGEYMGTGISGTMERRPELDRLMADAHRRRFGQNVGTVVPQRESI